MLIFEREEERKEKEKRERGTGKEKAMYFHFDYNVPVLNKLLLSKVDLACFFVFFFLLLCHTYL